MPFQSAVANQQGFGIPGEFFDDSPVRCEPFTLNSALASYNVFGSAFSVSSAGVAAAGNTGTQVYAGILVNPKGSALYGSVTTPTLALPNQAQAEIANMGCIVVLLTANSASYPVNVGDLVIFNNTTGLLQTIPPASAGALPVGYSPAYAVVDRFQAPTSAGQLAVIRLTTTPTIPVPA